MTLNASGPLSLGGATTGQSINLELGQAATALASINATNFRNLAGVSSGQISISNFYGKSNITYYAINYRGAGNWYPFTLGIDSTDNYYLCTLPDVGSYYYQVYGKIAAAGNSFSYLTGATITSSTGNLWRPGPSTAVTNASGFTMTNWATIPGDNFPTAVRAIGVTKISSTGSVSFDGTPTVYTWSQSGAAFTYLNGAPLSGAADSSGNMYLPLSGVSYQFTGYDCCGNPQYTNNGFFIGLWKYDSAGNLVSRYCLGYNNGTLPIYYYIPNIAPLSSGTFITAPATTTLAYYQVALVNSSVSAVSWCKTIQPQPSATYNNIGSAANVSTNPAKTVFCVGTSFNDQSNSGAQAVLIFGGGDVSTGTLSWGTYFRKTGPTGDLYIQNTVMDSSNNVYFVTSGISGFGSVFGKLNSSGAVQWQRRILFGATGSGASGYAQQINLLSTGVLTLFGCVTTFGGSLGNMIFQYPTDGSFTGTATVNGVNITVTASTINTGSVSFNQANSSLSGLNQGISYSTTSNSAPAATPTATIVRAAYP